MLGCSPSADDFSWWAIPGRGLVVEAAASCTLADINGLEPPFPILKVELDLCRAPATWWRWPMTGSAQGDSGAVWRPDEVEK
jgi:hypothetical protein